MHCHVNTKWHVLQGIDFFQLLDSSDGQDDNYNLGRQGRLPESMFSSFNKKKGVVNHERGISHASANKYMFGYRYFDSIEGTNLMTSEGL